MTKWTSVHESKPFGLCWVTIGWQHYAGETAVCMAWCDGDKFWPMEPACDPPPRGRAEHMEENWQCAVTHWMDVKPPKPAAKFALRDGATFNRRPTVKQLSEH